MPIDEYKKAKNIIKNSPKSDFDGPKSESLVQEAEKYLGIEFPPSYRQFLLDFGCGSIDGNEFYGIINNEFGKSSVPNGIWLTMEERKKFTLPKNLILIAEGYEGYLAIDINQRNDFGECPIIEWVGGNPNNSDKILYQDFGSYILEMISQ